MDLTAMSVSSIGKVSTTKDRVAVGGSRMLCGPTMLILKAARPLVNNKGLPTTLLLKGGLDPTAFLTLCAVAFGEKIGQPVRDDAAGWTAPVPVGARRNDDIPLPSFSV